MALIHASHCYITETQRTPGQFDIAGDLSSTFGITALVFGIIHSATAGWDDPLTTGAVIAEIFLLMLFVLNEWSKAAHSATSVV
jgi:hypothetical protein